MHFSCGFEVQSFEWSDHHVLICLKNEYAKTGSIFVYLPEANGFEGGELAVGGRLDNVTVTVNGKPCCPEILARPSICLHRNEIITYYCGRVLRVRVTIEASGLSGDGIISFSW